MFKLARTAPLNRAPISESTLGNGVEVGPYSTVRPGCVIGDQVHIGTHAELKNATLAPKVQVGHFSYLGDCEIGEATNIGAGAISCNYDGEQKHRTVIGNNAFIGSDTLLIAPVSVGNNSQSQAREQLLTKMYPTTAKRLGHLRGYDLANAPQRNTFYFLPANKRRAFILKRKYNMILYEYYEPRTAKAI